MEYLYAILVLFAFFGLSTFLSGFLGVILSILYAILGFYLGVESIIIGIGGLLGNLLNIWAVNRYFRNQNALTSAPRFSKISSVVFIVCFAIGILLSILLRRPDYSLSNIYILIILMLFSLIIIFILIKRLNVKPSNIENILIWHYLSFESLWLINNSNSKVDYVKLLTASGELVLQDSKYNSTKITFDEIYNIAFDTEQKYLETEYDIRLNTLLSFTLNFINAVNIRMNNPDAEIEINNEFFKKELEQLNKSKILKNAMQNINTNNPPKRYTSIAKDFIANHLNWYSVGMYGPIEENMM